MDVGNTYQGNWDTDFCFTSLFLSSQITGNISRACQCSNCITEPAVFRINGGHCTRGSQLCSQVNEL